MHYQKCDIFYDLKETRGVWWPEPDFRGTHRDSSRDCPGKTVTTGIHMHVHIRAVRYPLCSSRDDPSRKFASAVVCHSNVVFMYWSHMARGDRFVIRREDYAGLDSAATSYRLLQCYALSAYFNSCFYPFRWRL